MAFNPNAYNTRQYEVAALASGGTTLPPGTAVKLTQLPTGLSSPDFYFKVDVATSTDVVFGVVSNQSPSITSAVPGRVIGMNAGMIPVLMNATANKNDSIKVATTDGKWEKIGTGEVANAQLLEGGTMGNLSWATPILFKP